jgi:hypothetical protein
MLLAAWFSRVAAHRSNGFVRNVAVRRRNFAAIAHPCRIRWKRRTGRVALAAAGLARETATLPELHGAAGLAFSHH